MIKTNQLYNLIDKSNLYMLLKICKILRKVLIDYSTRVTGENQSLKHNNYSIENNLSKTHLLKHFLNVRILNLNRLTLLHINEKYSSTNTDRNLVHNQIYSIHF